MQNGNALLQSFMVASAQPKPLKRRYEHAHEAFSRGRDMISALSEPTRASERLRLDLDWFNAQIAALET